MWSFNVERKLIRNGDSGSARRGEEMNADEPIKAAISEQELTEDIALSLLKRPDRDLEVLERISKNTGLMKSRKVKLALISHPRTPRHVLLPLLRHLFTFELMRVALMPVIPADVKVAAEESLINRLEKLSLGEKLSLARRASGRVAAALLSDSEPRVISLALRNGRLTEAGVMREISRRNSSSDLVREICRDPKWSLRPEIAIALLNDESTPMEIVRKLAASLPKSVIQQILAGPHLSEELKRNLQDALVAAGTGT